MINSFTAEVTRQSEVPFAKAQNVKRTAFPWHCTKILLVYNFIKLRGEVPILAVQSNDVAIKHWNLKLS